MRNRYVQALLEKWNTQAKNRMRDPSREQQRGRGKLCASCDDELPQPHSPGYRQCGRCKPAEAHAVYMAFRYVTCNGTWHCRLLDEGRHDRLLKQLTFTHPEKLRETARRGKAMAFETAELRVNHAIAACSGAGLWLQLTPDQYLKLRQQP
jgi:hypothetical protein